MSSRIQPHPAAILWDTMIAIPGFVNSRHRKVTLLAQKQIETGKREGPVEDRALHSLTGQLPKSEMLLMISERFEQPQRGH